MNKKQKKMLYRIIIAFVLMVILEFTPIDGIIRFLLYMIPYLIIGYDILKKAFKGVINRQPFDECLLMAIATIGAIVLALYRSGDYTEAIAVMLFYQVGELFQSYAVGKSRRNISELMDIRPDYANLFVDGEYSEVDPDEVEIGSLILIKPGEKIPIDGVIVEGESSVDTKALTGESVPRMVRESDEVISGCINLSGAITIKTTKEFSESTASKILELVENASSRKSKSENFITKFARVYTPLVVYSAIALAFIPPVISIILGMESGFQEWLYRALTFLVISCPCALVVSIPLTFFAGIGGASKEGVLVKGSNYLELLSGVKYLAFDKTGTLTTGEFKVTKVNSTSLSRDELLRAAACAEAVSNHPIGKSILNEYGSNPDMSEVSDIKEISGKGVSCIVNGDRVLCGNAKLMSDNNISAGEIDSPGTVVYVAINDKLEGYIIISDVIKSNSKAAIGKLKALGIKGITMLTGDNKVVADYVAKDLAIDNVYSELLPGDKVDRVEEIIAKKAPKDIFAFVGDGINDAPVLSRADIGIAMGGMGSDAAIEAADVVLMDDDPLSIVKAIRISKKCIRIVYENIYFAIGIKVLCLLLGALGIANMWAAIFADVGVMVLAVLNAIRALRS